MNTPSKIEAGAPIEAIGGGGMLAPRDMHDVVEFAKLMSKAGPAIRKHFRENPGACMAVTLQALRWEMDPFAVANKSYFVNDQLAFEAQLIAAIVNTRAPLSKRPAITYTGEGDTRQCHVELTFDDGTVQKYDSPMFAQIHPKNSPLWKTEPDQQLAYYSIRSAARRYCPEVILGVYDRDEIDGAGEIRNITPTKHDYVQRLEAAKGETVVEFTGFNMEHVHAEIEQATGASEKPVDARSEETATDVAGDETAAPEAPEEDGLEHVSVHVGKALLDAFEMGLAECETEEEVAILSRGYSAQINDADAETKKQARLLRAKRLQELAEGGAE